jgi:F-type H+-transporting ATPase subunit alpha
MIHSFKYAKDKIGQVGEVVRTSRSLLEVTDLAGAVLGEGVSFESGGHGMVSKLGKNTVEVMSFTDKPLPIGEKVARTGEMLSVTVGDGMLGDTFDSLGYISGGEKEFWGIKKLEKLISRCRQSKDRQNLKLFVFWL